MEKKYRYALILNSVIVLFGFIVELLNLSHLSEMTDHGLALGAHLIMYFLILYYAVSGYKIPHGNLLKYLMFFFAFSLLTALNLSVSVSNILSVILCVLAMITVCHMAYRLDQVKKNRFLAAYVMLLLAILALSGISSFPEDTPLHTFLCLFSNCFLWLALATAYFTRFLAHKEAGLTVKKKEKTIRKA